MADDPDRAAGLRSDALSGAPVEVLPTVGPRRDSMNLIRLLLAAAVLVSHAFVVFGRPEPIWAGRTLGTWAVAGFFAISGHLIMGSGMRLPLGAFLRHRCARIYPGYWLALVVTSLAVCLWGLLHDRTDSLGSALTYVLFNASLVQVQTDIGGTLASVPYPREWNASLWTLAYEMACYLLVALVCRVCPERLLKVALPVLFVGCVGTLVVGPHVGDVPFVVRQFATLAGFFFGGALLRVFDLPTRAQRTLPFALGGIGLFVASTYLSERLGPPLLAPLLTWGLLALASTMPAPHLSQVHDLSYGLYLFAFPVSQALMATGWFAHLGVFILAVAIVTSMVALMSWRFVERPSLDWARSVRPATGRKL